MTFQWALNVMWPLKFQRHLMSPGQLSHDLTVALMQADSCENCTHKACVCFQMISESLTIWNGEQNSPVLVTFKKSELVTACNTLDTKCKWPSWSMNEAWTGSEISSCRNALSFQEHNRMVETSYRTIKWFFFCFPEKNKNPNFMDTLWNKCRPFHQRQRCD